MVAISELMFYFSVFFSKIEASAQRGFVLAVCIRRGKNVFFHVSFCTKLHQWNLYTQCNVETFNDCKRTARNGMEINFNLLFYSHQSSMKSFTLEISLYLYLGKGKYLSKTIFN